VSVIKILDIGISAFLFDLRKWRNRPSSRIAPVYHPRPYLVGLEIEEKIPRRQAEPRRGGKHTFVGLSEPFLLGSVPELEFRGESARGVAFPVISFLPRR